MVPVLGGVCFSACKCFGVLYTEQMTKPWPCDVVAQAEIEQIVKIGYLNGLFVLARSIGLIGHALDQKRLQQGLYRHPWEAVLYI